MTLPTAVSVALPGGPVRHHMLKSSTRATLKMPLQIMQGMMRCLGINILRLASERAKTQSSYFVEPLAALSTPDNCKVCLPAIVYRQTLNPAAQIPQASFLLF